MESEMEVKGREQRREVRGVKVKRPGELGEEEGEEE